MEREMKTLGELLALAIFAGLVYLACTHFGAFLVIGAGCGVLLAVLKVVKVLTR